MRTVFPLLLLAFPPVAFAQTKADPPAPAPGEAGANVYKQVLRSTVWVHSERGGGKLATGSGSLVDKGRRLVLTNYHVVGDVKKARVYFPDYGADKKAIPERKHYLDRGTLGIAGDVIEIDKEGDLALVRIDRVPDGVPELPLAAESPDPGQTVHSIGNPGRSGALWVYTPGKVRQVYSKKWQAKLNERTTIDFKAKVIETDSPTNPGDSGGPLVNDKGQLVGVTQGGALDAQALSIFVDLSEVKRLLARRSVQALRSTDTTTTADTKPADPAKPRRETAVKSKDDGKLFGADAWKAVQPAAEKLLKEKDIDLLVETIEALPKAELDKVKAMSKEDRDKFFKNRALERCKAEKLSGIYIFVAKNPTILWVEMVGEGAGKYPAGFGSRMVQTLLTAFKDKKFDEGLKEGLFLALDFQGLAEKKDDKKDEKKEAKK